ncbi:response regulator transcription factor [Paraburkholderia sp. BL21I4N1]|uniref:response regulator transcription factor n=1 Tax=Paraburkholderia sp. BL21I4N1 TaxID=1938801 RepID=UPI000CFCE9EC|nr:response regulator [Paraburkholderia sp. BL21I4N1]PQV49186.1 LuxR family two component transcriptional regulator [Paraburkholderia sp. BL21I4N1]
MSDHVDAVVHVVDDDPTICTALTRLLTHAGYTVKSYPAAGDFLVSTPDTSKACLLLDLEMPGPGGLDLQRALHKLGNEMPIVFISAHHDIPKTVMAIKAGASDFLLKPIDSQALLAAIETALAGATPSSSPAVADDQPLKTALSSREQVVLRGIVAGRLNKQIAAELAVSERTVKTCRADLMNKLHAHSLAELVILAEPLVRMQVPF